VIGAWLTRVVRHVTGVQAVFDAMTGLSADIGALRIDVEATSAHVQSIRAHTWHAKETAHASVLATLAAADGRYSHPLSLTRHRSQVYSQNGEDGMLAEIFQRIGLPDRPFFVEIGVEDGQENNSRLLLEQGWHGVWIEASETAAAEARNTFSHSIRSGDLRIIVAPATAENVNALLDQADVPADFDLLSVDVDQNTSHIWRAIERRSRVACIEYNASLPPARAVEVPYDPGATWDGTNWYGASLKSIENIGAVKGLALVGCDFVGANAFLVAKDKAVGRFREPFSAEAHYELPKYSLLSHIGHRPSREARQWVVRHDSNRA